jgi:hypothetical protein
MGLSIAYQLNLPAATPRAVVEERLVQLQECARRLPFALVTDFMETRAGDTLGPAPQPLELEFWFRSWAALTFDPDPGDGGGDELPDSIGFLVMPGNECEPLAIGMAWAPARDDDWTALPDQPYCWSWQSVCKTQYASMVSPDHFVQCHTSVVALLDAAAGLGFQVRVADEGGYWESRDPDRLLAEVETMNRLIAAFAGGLHDAIGAEHPIDAPIFAHPDFERLETKGMPPPP